MYVHTSHIVSTPPPPPFSACILPYLPQMLWNNVLPPRNYGSMTDKYKVSGGGYSINLWLKKKLEPNQEFSIQAGI